VSRPVLADAGLAALDLALPVIVLGGPPAAHNFADVRMCSLCAPFEDNRVVERSSTNLTSGGADRCRGRPRRAAQREGAAPAHSDQPATTSSVLAGQLHP
jgi:hypothetical protein